MSNINPNNIDGTYPVAGQDNDSQGFRDNFTNVRNNFTFAKGEIEDLAAKVILKQALVGGVLNNDLAGSPLIGATVSNFSELRKDFTSVSGAQTVTYAEGHYQKLTTTGDVTLTFAGWPASGKNGRMRLEIIVTDTAYTVSFTNTIVNLSGVPGLNGNELNFDDTGTFLYEFESDDGASTVNIRDLNNAAGFTNKTLEVVSTTSSAVLGDIGLEFTAVAGKRYSYEAQLPISHSSTDVTTFSVSYGGGVGYATVEQQTTATSAFTTATIATSDAAAVTGAGSISTRMVRISGVYYNSTAGNLPVALRFATAGGTLTVLAGANLTFRQTT